MRRNTWLYSCLAIVILVIILRVACYTSNEHVNLESLDAHPKMVDFKPTQSSSMQRTSQNGYKKTFLGKEYETQEKFNLQLAENLKQLESSRITFLYKNDYNENEPDPYTAYVFKVKAPSQQERDQIINLVTSGRGATKTRGDIVDWRDKLEQDFLWPEGYQEFTLLIEFYHKSKQWQFSACAEYLLDKENSYGSKSVNFSTSLAGGKYNRVAEAIKLLPKEDQELFELTRYN
jgi:hypothetical protein